MGSDKEMRTYIDETGHIYGRLTVLGFSHLNRHGAHFLCQCVCGKRTVVRGSSLRRERCVSCGCLRQEHIKAALSLPSGEAGFNELFSVYRKNAVAKNLAFELNEDQFRALTQGLCHYCGDPPSQIFRKHRKKGNGKFTYNGIDRKDNSLGYVLSNCVPCCGRCNLTKRSMEYFEFKAYINKVYWHWLEEANHGTTHLDCA